MVVVVLLVALLQLATAQRCLHSGYCSAGKLKPFSGDIHASFAFQTAMAARSYKKELIILVATEARLLPALQTIENLDKLGIGHVLLMSTGAQGCRDIINTVPHIGCAWDSFELPMVGKDIHWITGMAPLWHTRYRTMARALRMGINVLCTDSDIVLFDDPYRYFKSPPFSDYVVLNQAEVLYDNAGYSGNTGANGGIIYIQNASPVGPATWLMGEVIDRLLRWIDDGFNHTGEHGINTACNYVDQDCLNDVLTSVLVGRPFFRGTLTGCTSDTWRKEHEEVLEATEVALQDKWLFNSSVPLPHFMWPAAGGNTSEMRWAWMKQPHARGVWPEKWGGNLYPPKRGSMSLRFQQQLRDDCSGCPLWPDAEDGSPEAIKAADATPPERYLFMPPWMALGYYPRGRLGYWVKAFTGVPQQVIGHSHYMPETDHSVSKLAVRMMVGEYDWELSRKVAGGPGIFFMSRYHGHEVVPGGQSKRTIRYDHSPPRLIALHPRVRLDLLGGYEEFMAIVEGMRQLAVLSDRAVLLPDLPCNMTMLSDGRKNDDKGSLPLKITPEWFPWGARDNLQCVFRQFLNDECLSNGRGMLMMEFRHYVDKYGVRYDLEPRVSNTAFIAATLGARGADQAANGPAGVIASVSEKDARQHLQDHSFSQVLYLAQPVVVEWENTSVSLGLRDAGERRFDPCVRKEIVTKCAEGIHHRTKELLPRKPRTEMWAAEMHNGRLRLPDIPGPRPGGTTQQHGKELQLTGRKLVARASAEAVPSLRDPAVHCEPEAGGLGYARHSLQASMLMHAKCAGGHVHN